MKKLLRLYVYVKLGVANYLNFMIALFNTASLVWYFLGLKNSISFSEFIIMFFVLYLPFAAVLGYYDLKKLVAKTASEVRPYWKRPNFIITRYMLGAMIYPIEGAEYYKLTNDERVRECTSKAVKAFLKLFLSEGKEIPRDPCFCKLAYEEGILDKEHYEMCVKVLKESE